MIVASAGLVAIAFVTLVVGIFQSGLSLIWVSIASSVAAAVLLGLGVVRARPQPATVMSFDDGEDLVPSFGTPEPLGVGAMEREEAPSTLALDFAAEEEVVEEEEEEEELAPEPEPARPARASRARKPAAAKKAPAKAAPKAAPKKAAPKAAPAKKSAPKAAPVKKAPAKAAAGAARDSVVVIPDRDKFHKDSCRFAKSPGAMTLTKAQARREGYKRCSVCKP